MNSQVTSAVFDSRAEAERAIDDLRQAGVPDGALSILAQHGDQVANGQDTVDDADDGSIGRGIIGGGALGAGLGVAALAIPGVGPLVAAGAIAAAAIPGALGIGAAAGAVAGTLNEALHKHGVSEEDAGYYSDRISSGGVFVSVDRTDNVDDATVRDVLARNGGHSSSQPRATSTTY